MIRVIGLTALLACIGLFAWMVKARQDGDDFSFNNIFSFSAGKKVDPEYVTDFKEARKQSKEMDKPMLVIFSASWCGPCKANKKKLYPHKDIQPYHDKFVWVYLDVDKEENKRVVDTFRVESYPKMFVVSPEGKSIASTGGSQRPEKFEEFLSSALGR